MFDRYFGIPQHVIRSGLWANMKPSQQSLYICLMHESERCSTRLLRRPDASLCELSGLSSRAFCDARKKLQEIGLIQCRRGAGNIYLYTICNPENLVLLREDSCTGEKELPQSLELKIRLLRVP